MERLTLKSWIPIALAAMTAIIIGGALLSGKFYSADFQLGASVSMTSVFGLVWIFGVRYPDVSWMLVTTVMLSLTNFFFPAAAQTKADLMTYGTANFALMLSYGVFALAFFRFGLKNAAVTGVFAFNVATFFLTTLLLPENLLIRFRFDGAFQSYVGSGLLAAAALYGFASIINLPPKRQRYVGIVASSCIAASAVLFIMGKTGHAGGSNVSFFFNYILSSTFGMLLLADLVIFHRTNVSEATSREAAPGATDDSSLGRTIQTLLLPESGIYEGREFLAEVVFSPSDRFGGDWHYVMETSYDRKIIFGEISGSGASGALGVAAVVSLLHEARQRELNPQAICKFVNYRLIQLFERKLSTTLTVLSLATDGTVEVSNSGGPGFIELSRKGARQHPLHSTPLGISYEPEIALAGFSLSEGGMLISATSGHFNHPAEVKKLMAHLDENIESHPDFRSVREAALATGDASAEGTDQTLILVQKRRLAMLDQVI